MTATLDMLNRQIRNAEDLAAVVRTMKTLAAVSIRQYEEAVESLRDYRRNVDNGLRMLLSHPEPGAASEFERLYHSRELAVVFGSDQGMCGQFNQQVVAFVTDRFAVNRAASGNTQPAANAGPSLDDDQQQIIAADASVGDPIAPAIIAVGHRCGGLLEEAGFEVPAVLPEAGSVAAITDCVQDLLNVIDRLRHQHGTGRVALYFSQRRTATVTEPHRAHVLPVDLRHYAGHWKSHRQSRTLPMHTESRRDLLSALLNEHLFVSLFRACAESLSSENAARIQSMQTAERNITERLAELRSHYHQSRQTSITEELLDVVSGFEVLSRREAARQTADRP